MFHLIGIIFLLFFVILFVGVSIVLSLIRSLFGSGKKNTRTTYTTFNQDQTPNDSDATTPEEGELHPKRKKLFDKEDGEYVDFEEIK